MNKEEFERLATHVADHTATDEQIDLYSRYMQVMRRDATTWGPENMGTEPNTRAELFKRVDRAISKEVVSPFRIMWSRIAVAVVILACLGTASFLFLISQKTEDSQPQEITTANDISPGGNRATLKIGNGATIELTEMRTGASVNDGGIKITKLAEGKLVYTLSGTTLINGHPHTLLTPQGGTYQVTLPDGSKIWVNAESSITYIPTEIANGKRQVQLSGEAYFEISGDITRPFIAFTDRQQVEVLGTHFNINNYKDEAETRTTLLEGRVKVSLLSNRKNSKRHGLILNPGEESSLRGSEFSVSFVNLEERIAWQRGRFLFDNEHITSIMRKIARWYGVEAVYPEKMPRDLNFSGSISRNKNLSQILKIVEMTGCIHFKISGRKLYVMPNPDMV